MKQVFKVDENGLYIETVIIQLGQEPSDRLIPIKFPDGLCKPRWDGQKWEEAATPEEVDAIINPVQPLSPFEQQQKDLADLTFLLMMKGVI